MCSEPSSNDNRIPGHEEYKPSWFDAVGASPFEKSPMEGMKKTYYKDMSSSQFDPGSYYKSGQPQDVRSMNGHHSSDKEYSDSVFSRHEQGPKSQPHNNEPGNRGHGSRYFYSKNYKRSDDLDGASYQQPVEQHHQKYFKQTQQSGSKKHSFDLDEPDDVPLNINDNKSRGTQNGNFHVGEVLNSSLNVPKGIHVHRSTYAYGKK